MSEKLEGAVVDSVTNANFKNLGDQPSFYAGMGMANAVSHQNRLNILAENLLSKGIKLIHEVDPTEAVAVNKVATGNDLAAQIAALSSSVAAIQQMMKGAQSTPPETAKPT